MPHGTDISPANLTGERMFVQSRVTDLKGKPLAGVPVDVWHADDDGYYDSQKPSYKTKGPSSRARFITDADGRFFFRTILPCSYPIPTDGPVGEMILQSRRHPMRPAHIHFLVDAPGYEPLVTHVFIEGDKFLDTDVVFGVKDDLISRGENGGDRGRLKHPCSCSCSFFVRRTKNERIANFGCAWRSAHNSGGVTKLL